MNKYVHPKVPTGEGCTLCIRICVYTYTCPCARVNAVSRPFFRERGPRPPSQILSLHVYNMPTVSTISRPRLLVVHSVYRLYPGKREYAQCPQTMQSVYKLCTVSTGYAQVNVYVHSVYKPRTVSTNYKLCTVSTDYTYTHSHSHSHNHLSCRLLEFPGILHRRVVPALLDPVGPRAARGGPQHDGGPSGPGIPASQALGAVATAEL